MFCGALSNYSFVDFNPGEWVLFEYEGETYPGEIIRINKEDLDLTINAMESLPKDSKLFKWPKLKDVHNYPLRDIIKKIKSPISLDKRGLKYTFPDSISFNKFN